MDDDKRWLAIGKAVERACMDLPDGYELRIELENGWAVLSCMTDEGERIDTIRRQVIRMAAAQLDEAVRVYLISKGWTPPATTQGSNHG